VILGAWGCGAYGNPVATIAQAWKREVLGVDSKGRPKSREAWEGLEDVIFAITDNTMLDAFNDCFRDALVENLKMKEDAKASLEGTAALTESMIASRLELDVARAEQGGRAAVCPALVPEY